MRVALGARRSPSRAGSRWPRRWRSARGRSSSARRPCGGTRPSWTTAAPPCPRCPEPPPASSASPACTASSSTSSLPSFSPCSWC